MGHQQLHKKGVSVSFFIIDSFCQITKCHFMVTFMPDMNITMATEPLIVLEIGDMGCTQGQKPRDVQLGLSTPNVGFDENFQ